MGAFWDPIGHYIVSGYQYPKKILDEHLVIIGHQAHQVDYIPAPHSWKYNGHQKDDYVHTTHVELQASMKMG